MPSPEILFSHVSTGDLKIVLIPCVTMAWTLKLRLLTNYCNHLTSPDILFSPVATGDLYIVVIASLIMSWNLKLRLLSN